jgi:hypothetical protein
MNATRLAAFLEARGFRVRLWRERRVYVSGYGKDVSCAIEPVADAKTLDDAVITVSSTWRSPHAGLRCKGVKHTLLWDLFALGLLSQKPPRDWQAVKLDDRPPVARAPIEHETVFDWPDFPASQR